MRALCRWFSLRQVGLVMGGLAILSILAARLFLDVGSPGAYDLPPSERRIQDFASREIEVGGAAPEESSQEHLKVPETASEIPDDGEHAEGQPHGSRPDVSRDEANVVAQERNLPNDQVEVHSQGSAPDVPQIGVAVVEERYLPDDGLNAYQSPLELPPKEPIVTSFRSPQSGSVAQSDFPCERVIGIGEEECRALVALYDSTDGPNWRRNEGWLLTTTPCSWYGVVCNKQGYVAALELFRNELSGTIPLELGNLVGLETLALSSNALTGTIPSELGNLTSLSNLYLNTNQLNGSIPPELGNLASLTRLVLKSNQLSGAIPAELGSGAITNTLRVLYLSCNRLSEEVPHTIVNLVNLQPYSTDLGYNMLTAPDSEVEDFLDNKDPDWAQTQTVPPTLVRVVEVSGRIKLAWTPIAYTGDGGYYEVQYAPTPGGTPEFLGQTNSKEDTIFPPGDAELPCSHCDYTVRTCTLTHGEAGYYVYQQNKLCSPFSAKLFHRFLPIVWYTDSMRGLMPRSLGLE